MESSSEMKLVSPQSRTRRSDTYPDRSLGCVCRWTPISERGEERQRDGERGKQEKEPRACQKVKGCLVYPHAICIAGKKPILSVSLPRFRLSFLFVHSSGAPIRDRHQHFHRHSRRHHQRSECRLVDASRMIFIEDCLSVTP